MSDLKYVEVAEVILHARPGTNIGDCLRDALKVAVIEWRNVCIVHNGQEYVT